MGIRLGREGFIRTGQPLIHTAQHFIPGRFAPLAAVVSFLAIYSLRLLLRLEEIISRALAAVSAERVRLADCSAPCPPPTCSACPRLRMRCSSCTCSPPPTHTPAVCPGLRGRCTAAAPHPDPHQRQQQPQEKALQPRRAGRGAASAPRCLIRCRRPLAATGRPSGAP